MDWYNCISFGDILIVTELVHLLLNYFSNHLIFLSLYLFFPYCYDYNHYDLRFVSLNLTYPIQFQWRNSIANCSSWRPMETPLRELLFRLLFISGITPTTPSHSCMTCQVFNGIVWTFFSISSIPVDSTLAQYIFSCQNEGVWNFCNQQCVVYYPSKWRYWGW